MFGSLPGPRYEQLLNRVYDIMRESPVSPGDFITAYSKSRFVALLGDISPEDYFIFLQVALEKGVSTDDVYSYLEKKVAEKKISKPQ